MVWFDCINWSGKLRDIKPTNPNGSKETRKDRISTSSPVKTVIWYGGIECECLV